MQSHHSYNKPFPTQLSALLLLVCCTLRRHCCWHQPVNPVMALERNPDSTAEEKAQAWQQLLQPEGTFKQRLGLLDAWLVRHEVNATDQQQLISKLKHSEIWAHATRTAKDSERERLVQGV
jgi:hypothetical protein